MSKPWEPLEIVMGGYELKPGRNCNIYVGRQQANIKLDKNGALVITVSERIDE